MSGTLEQLIVNKDAEISRLGKLEMVKDLQLHAQQPDFRMQLITEQNARKKFFRTEFKRKLVMAIKDEN